MDLVILISWVIKLHHLPKHMKRKNNVGTSFARYVDVRFQYKKIVLLCVFYIINKRFIRMKNNRKVV